MKLEKEPDKLIIIDDNDQKLCEVKPFGAEILFHFFKKNPVVITEDLDENLYNGFLEIMNNEYYFDDTGLNHKTKDEFIWISDQYYDDSDMVDRMIIKRTDNQIILSYDNPYCNKHNINRKYGCISFSPGGNGVYCKNKKNQTNLQDEIGILFNNTLLNGKIKKYRK